ncbi:hypothetical protein E2C01_099550 [Portunus trituberculatus]|uniref:Uncharacterized protein n=1 Tax=Portunus trituberculatus TaxID=210409 RepID=A0A5B7K0L5_PORTR|nr:hypothetical protein [Portunus trituberculatus]
MSHVGQILPAVRDKAEMGPGRCRGGDSLPRLGIFFHRPQPPGAFREVEEKMTGNNGTIVAGKTQCGTTSVLVCTYTHQ